jgi:hypothetical protein
VRVLLVRLPLPGQAAVTGTAWNSTLRPGKPPGKGCGKIRYRDEIAAKLALARAQWRDKPGRPKAERRAYFHPLCRGWHLTAAHGAGKRSGKVRQVAPAPTERPRKAPRDTGFPPAVKLLIRARAGNGDPEAAMCEACGIHLGLHGGQIQHIYARGKGGTRDPLYSTAANGALLCGTRYTGCHGLCEDREDRHMNEMGFWRKRNGQEKPGDYPIMLHGRGGGVTVWLTAGGAYAFEAPEAGAA